MNWIIIGRIADILGITGFLISVGIFRIIYAKTTLQKETYQKERDQLLGYLNALRENIWNDGLDSYKIQDTLQSAMFEYQIKYLLISTPRCIFHAFRCSHLLRAGISESNTQKIREDINFLIARLTKKE